MQSNPLRKNTINENKTDSIHTCVLTNFYKDKTIILVRKHKAVRHSLFLFLFSIFYFFFFFNLCISQLPQSKVVASAKESSLKLFRKISNFLFISQSRSTRLLTLGKINKGKVSAHQENKLCLAQQEELSLLHNEYNFLQMTPAAFFFF